VVSPQLELHSFFVRQHDVVKAARRAAQRPVFNMRES
jgi:hypothetical protein